MAAQQLALYRQTGNGALRREEGKESVVGEKMRRVCACTENKRQQHRDGQDLQAAEEAAAGSEMRMARRKHTTSPICKGEADMMVCTIITSPLPPLHALLLLGVRLQSKEEKNKTDVGW